MSKLSELLNPAPTSQTSPAATQAPQAPQVQPLILDGRDRRTPSFSHGSPTHSRYPSLTSPGLDALANAASNTAPILSPPQNSNAFAQPFQASYQQTSHAQYGSRPGSSHTLPPLSDGFSNNGGHQHSSGLEQYHHLSGGGERRVESVDHSARLPPLQRSPDQQPYTTDAFQQLSEASRHVHDEMQGEPSSTQLHQVSPSRELNQNTDAPSTSQIRQPSPGISQLLSATNLPNAQSEQVEIKAELTENPLDTSQIEPSAKEGSGVASTQPTTAMGTPKALADIKNDATQSPGPTENPTGTLSKPKPAPSRKRPAPGSKKGTANTVKPAPKKRKLDNESVDGTPPGQRTGTPATSRASMTPAPKQRKQGSVTPARSSSVANGPEGESDEDDNEIYCICRKPDDHTLMIGCDGPCEDWYHVRCVGMDAAKSKLIQKWYCPVCAEKGNETLWKRMCRLEGCQEPARLEGETKSKYCSNEHGAEFMRTRLVGGEPEQKKTNAPRSHKKKRQDSFTDNFGNAGDSDDDRIYLRGGIMRAPELKAVVDGSTDVNAFHRLGEGVLSPPATASPEGEDAKKVKIVYTTEEKAQLEEISDKREKCRARKKMLDDRDKLLFLITARGKAVLAELKEKDKSVKDICGYDSRLTWSDQEFNEWRASGEGQKALEKGGVLGPPAAMTNKDNDVDVFNGQATAGNSESKGGDNANEDEEEIGKGVCKKKRCERHRQWLKLQQQDNLFEKDQARQEMKRLEAEEKGLRNRATIRSLEVMEGGEG